ncbi:MAG: cation:proton antiporter [Cellvibrionales bacterium]|nr:cation:proton antiporter [Cellvibrionales bacterium]
MLTEYIFLVFTGAALLGCLAMYGRQPLIITYIALGALIGPHGLGLVGNLELLDGAAEIGIIFLLFLIGLDMQPTALLAVLRKATTVTLLSSAAFFAIGAGFAWLWGFTLTESLVIGAGMMFSSTIIGIKLLPTTVLHHRHSGELIVGLLLLQDFLAIFVLILLLSGAGGQLDLAALAKAAVAVPAVTIAAFLVTRYLLLPIITRFDRIQEFTFLLAIGWCMGVAELAQALGLALEIGAFIAGITLATSPISQYIALSLKPLRDFFLVVFFFALGAGFNFDMLGEIALPALLLAALMLGLKPVIFSYLVRGKSATRELSWDLGFRLGQISEFSLLIAFLAFDTRLIGEPASLLVQATAIITFLVSSYIVVFNYPNPIAVSERLRRD